MGIVSEFEESGDPAWDVSAGAYGGRPPDLLNEIVKELKEHTDIVFVVSGAHLMLYNKNYLKIKVVANETSKT